MQSGDGALARDQAVLAFDVAAASGSTFDPGEIVITDSSGAVITPIFSQNDGSGSVSSRVVASLPVGTYQASITGENETTGLFTLDTSLLGDLDGDGDVEPDEVSVIRDLRQSGSFDAAADFNADGLITAIDFAQARANRGNAVTIEFSPVPPPSPTDVNQIPVAGTTTLSTDQDTAVEIDLRTLASDVETSDDALIFAVQDAVNGTTELLADGFTARFTPTAGFSGAGSFAYTVTDTGNGTAAALTAGPATLPVNVEADGVVPPPVGVAPAVSLANSVTELPASGGEALGLVVADIVVTDPDDGPNVLSLSGPDAGLFVISDDQTQLLLAAGTVLDPDVQGELNVTVNVDDATLGSTPDGSALLTIAIVPVVVDPPAPVAVAPSVALANPVTELDASDGEAFDLVVADIVVTDPDGGTNVLSLSGLDAGLFVISDDQTQLLLAAGTVLDPDVQGELSVTVNVDDATLGSTPDSSATLTITVVPDVVTPLPPVVDTFDIEITPPAELVLDGQAITSGFFTVASIWAFDQALTATQITPPAPIAAEIGSGIAHAIASVPVGTRVVSVVGFFDAVNPDLPNANFNLLIGSITDSGDNLGFTAFLPNNTADTAFQITNLAETASVLDNVDLFSTTDAKPTLSLTGGDFEFDNGVDAPIFINLTPAGGDGSPTSANFQPHGTVATPRGAQPLVVVNEGQTATNGGSFLGSTLSLTSIAATSGTATLTGPNSFTYSLPTADGPDDSRFVTVTGSDAAGNTVSVSFDVVVNNVAPLVNLGGPFTVDAGDTVTLTPIATDVPADTLSFAFDLDNDGAFDDAFGPTVEFDPAAFGLAPGDVQTVAVQVTDDDGGVGVDTTTVAVNTPVPVINQVPVAAGATLNTDFETSVEVDLRTLASDAETPDAQLTFAVANAANGAVELLADGFTVRGSLPMADSTAVPALPTR